MSKKEKAELFREEESFVNQKKRKGVIIPFLICLLIAFAIWLYASNAEDEKRKEEEGQGAPATAQCDPCFPADGAVL